MAYRSVIGQPINDTGWMFITRQGFDDFRISGNNSTAAMVQPVRPPPPQLDPVKEFCHGIIRDATQYIPLKDDAAWDNWNRSTIAQARAQDVEQVLDLSYAPSTADETSLFEEKQKYKYAVFEKTLLTDKGKALVKS